MHIYIFICIVYVYPWFVMFNVFSACLFMGVVKPKLLKPLR